MQSNLHYEEAPEIKDRTTHNSNIEKIFYFQQIDKVILYETGMKMVKIYNAKTMAIEKQIQCIAVILAIEFCADFNAIAVSLSDRSIIFFDTVG